MRWLVFTMACWLVLGSGFLFDLPALMVVGFVGSLVCFFVSLHRLGPVQEVSHATPDEDFDSIEMHWPGRRA